MRSYLETYADWIFHVTFPELLSTKTGLQNFMHVLFQFDQIFPPEKACSICKAVIPSKYLINPCVCGIPVHVMCLWEKYERIFARDMFSRVEPSVQRSPFRLECHRCHHQICINEGPTNKYKGRDIPFFPGCDLYPSIEGYVPLVPVGGVERITMAICFLQPNRLYNVLNTHGYQFDQDKNLTHMIDLFMNDKLLSGFSRITHRHQYDAVLAVLEQYGFVKKNGALMDPRVNDHH